jgi:PPP family 3-phenylpropionic acid transporter
LYLPLFFASTALTVGASWLLFNLLKRSADAIVDAGAIRASSLGSFQFESTRMWGSVGFVVATLIFGFFVDYFGQSIILYGGATIVVLVFLSGLPLWSELSKSTGKSVELNDLGEFLQAKDFMLPFALITTAFCLITASHACMYVYFSLYLEALGWSASAISFAWNLGVCSEILMFIFFRHFERKLGLQTTFMISCAITASRWFLLGFSNDSSLILALQLLHSFSFGGCYLCAAKLVPRILPNHLADRGQGVMIAIGFGIGSFAGRLLFGFLADGTSSYLEVQQLFISAGYIAVIATALSVMFRMKKLKVAPESVSDDQAPA